MHIIQFPKMLFPRSTGSLVRIILHGIRSGYPATLTALAFLAMISAAHFPTPAYGSGGSIIWQFGYSVSSIQLTSGGVVDPTDGSVIVTGTSNNDYQTVKINAAGNDTLWSRSFDKAGGDDQANAIVMDSKGHIIVTGTAYNGSNNDIVTIKYCGRTYTDRLGYEPGEDPEACTAGETLWEATYNGSANGHDHGVAIAVDGFDNIYVGGKSQSFSGDFDYRLLKYYASGPLTSGGPTWQRNFNGSGNDNDYISDIDAVTINGSSYVVVTGNTKNNATPASLDIHTIKYDSAGAVLWSSPVTTAEAGNDYASRVSFGADGKVVVCGYLARTSRDIYTIRYNLAGNKEYDAYYATANTDEPSDLAIDTNGDVYVTGKSYVTLQNYNFITIRYAAANFAQVWAKTYDSPGHDEDLAIAITVDPLSTGGIFVAGTTMDNSNDLDFRTIKYEKTSGNELWNVSFDGAAGDRNDAPSEIAQLAGDGSIFVIGYSDAYTASSTDLDYYVIKYDPGLLDPPTGLVATTLSETKIGLTWSDNTTNELGFEIHRDTSPFTISGDTLLTTVGQNIMAYNDSVSSHTRYYYRLRAYTADNTSYSSNEATALSTILNYPAPSWVFTYDSSHDAYSFNDMALAITMATDNNPVVTGYNSDETNSNDYYTMKLNRVKDGNGDVIVQWADWFDASGGQVDKGYGVVVDINNEVITTGYGQIAQNNEVYTVKSPADGLEKIGDYIYPPIWDDTYESSGSDYPVAMALGPDGLTAAVAAYGNNGDNDIFLIKYAYSDGGAYNTNPPAWVSIYNYGSEKHDYASDLVFDSSGNIIVTGMCNGDNVMATGNFDLYTAKYAAATGNRIWTRCDDINGGDDRGYSIAIDGNDDIYVTGYATIGGNKDFYTVKYAGTDGSVRWSQPYNGPASGDDRAATVEFDPINVSELIVAGTRLTTAGNNDFYILRYNPNSGTVIREIILDREFSDEHLVTMAKDPTGNICVVGTTGDGADADIIGVSYGWNGEILGSFQYQGNGNNLDEPTGITVSDIGEYFVSGYFTNNDSPPNNDYLVLQCQGSALQAPWPFNLTSYYHWAHLTWDNSHNLDETGFEIQRKQDSCTNDDSGNWLPVTTLGATSTSYDDYGDAGLEAGATYCYRIRSLRNSESSRWLEHEIPTTTPPPPANLAGSLSDPVLLVTALSWNNNIAGETSYDIYRCTGVGCNDSFQLIYSTASDATQYSDDTLCEENTYRYKILARNSQYGWESDWSNTVEVTTGNSTAYETPISNFSATLSSEGRIDLAWTDQNSGETGYTIYRCFANDSCTNFSIFANVELPPAFAPIGHYHLDGFWTGQAGEALDSSGNNYHGTPTGNAHTGPGGRYGRAGYFDGSGDYVAIPATIAALANVTDNSFSLAAWAKPAAVPPNNSSNDSAYTIIGRPGNNMNLFYDASSRFGLTIRNSTNTAYTVTSTASFPADDEWHQVIGIADTSVSRIYLYVDGNLQGNDSFSGTLKDFGTVAYYIGAAAITGDYQQHFNGLIDDAALFNRVLSSAEVSLWHQTCYVAGGSLPAAFSDTSVQLNTSYRYQVGVYNSADDCPWQTTHTATVTRNVVLQAPSAFNAAAVNTTSINLDWNDTCEFETGFEIQRCGNTAVICATNDSLFSALTEPDRNASSYYDTTVSAGNSYTYRIRARNQFSPSWDTAWSYDSVSTQSISAPSEFTAARVSEEELALSWDLNTTDEDGIDLERCTGTESFCGTNDSRFSTLASLANGVENYSDINLIPSTTYTYRIQVFKNIGYPNEWQTNWIYDSNNTASYEPVLQVTAIDTTTLQLSWNNSTGRETDYVIQRCMGASCSFNDSIYDFVGRDRTSYIDNDACQSISYRYRVKAVEAGLSNGQGGTWTKRQPLNLTNFTSNYPMQLVIPYDSDMQADFADIRFWDNEAKVEIDYVISSKIDGNAAIVWIMTGASNNILLYYGNSAAISSSRETVMDTVGNSQYVELFDNFHGSTLNASLWAMIGSTSRIYQNDGLILDGIATSSNNGIISKQTFTREAGKVFLVNIVAGNNPSGTDISSMGWAVNQTATVSTSQAIHHFRLAEYLLGYCELGSCLNISPSHPYTTGFPYDLKVELLANGATYSVVGGGLNATNWYTDWDLLITRTSSTTTPMRVAVFNFSHDAVIDWLMVLDPPSPAPAYSFGNEEGGSFTFPHTWEIVSEPDEQTTLTPLAPFALETNTVSQTALEISWTAGSSDETSFIIEHCAGDNDSCMADPENNFTVLWAAANDSQATSFTHNSLIAETSHTYRFIVSKNASCSWGPLVSETVTGITATPPAPTSLSPTSYSNTQINLSWSEGIAGETGFEIYRCQGSGCNDSFVLVGETAENITVFSDILGCQDTVYRYQVRGVNSDTGLWQTEWSNLTADVSTHGMAQITGLTASWISEGRISLAWNDSNVDTSGYTIYRCSGNDSCTSFASLANIETNPMAAALALHHMDDFWSGSPDEAVDNSGNNHHGTAGGDAYTVPDGKFGRAAYFDGDNDYLTLGDIDSLDTPETFTVSLWFYRQSDNASATSNNINNVLIAQSSQSSNDNLEIGTQGTNIEFYLDTADLNTVYGSVDGGITNNTWHHLVLVYDANDSNETKLYLDGSLLQEFSDGGGSIRDSGTSPLSLAIAGPGDLNAGDFHGMIDDAALFTEALSAAAVAELFRTYAMDSQPLTSTFEDLNLLINTPYRYQIAAYNNDSFCRWVTSHPTTATISSVLHTPAPFTATALNTTVITLGWNDSCEFETGFEIQRCDNTILLCGTNDSLFVPLATVGHDSTAFNDSTVHTNSSSTYRVRAINGNGISWQTDWEYDAADTPDIIAPEFTVTPYSEEEITLSWTIHTTDEDGFEIQRCQGNDSFCAANTQLFGSLLTFGNPESAVTSRDFNLSVNTDYSYRIRSFKNIGQDNQWTTAWVSGSASTKDYEPALIPGGYDSTRISLSWNDSAIQESAYVIQRCTGPGCSFNDSSYGVVSRNTTSFTDTGGCSSTTYSYRVKAVEEGLANGNGGSWTRKKVLTITNFTPSYPMQLSIVYDADMQADFADLRFWDASSEVELSYSISSQVNGSSAVVWIVTGTTNSIEMYYGNSAAVSASDDNLMEDIGTSNAYVELFDNFAGTAIDTSIWTKFGSTYLSVNDALILDGGINAVWDQAIISKQTFTRETGNQLLANIVPLDNPDTAAEEFFIGWETDQIANPASTQGLHLLDWNVFQFRVGEKGNAYELPVASSYTAGYPYDMRVTITAQGADYAVYGGGASAAYPAWTGLHSLTENNDSTMRVAVHQKNHDARINWIMVLNPPLPEPGYSFGSEAGGSYTFPHTWELISETVELTTLTPQAPTDLAVEGISQTEMEITWTPNNPDENSFVLEHCAGDNDTCMADPDTTFSTLLSWANDSSVSSHVHSGLESGSHHTYRIKVSKSGVFCDWGPIASNIASGETLGPPAPSNVAISTATPANFTLTWEDNTVTNNIFSIERCAGTGCSDFSEIATLEGNGLTFTDVGACPDADYNYRIVGKNVQFAVGSSLSNNGGAAWSRRKELTIADFIANFQVSIEVPYDPDMQADFDDLRFYNENDSTELAYWIARKTDGESAVVWIKTTSASNQKITMYYGNPNAASSSNGNNIFSFFDDFDDGVIDTAKWPTQVINAGMLTETGGNLRLARNNKSYIHTSQTWPYSTTGIITARIKTPSPPDYSTYKGWTPIAFRHHTLYSGTWNYHVAFNEYDNGSRNLQEIQELQTYTSLSAADLPIAQWHQVSIILKANSGTTKTFAYSSVFEQDDTFNLSSGDRNVVLVDQPDYSIKLGANQYSNTTVADDMEGLIDWVFFRQYAATEPVISMGNEELAPILVWKTDYGLGTPADITTEAISLATDFAVTESWDGALQLNWTDNLSDETGYIIERCGGAACAIFEEVARTTDTNILENFNHHAETFDFWIPLAQLGGNDSTDFRVVNFPPASAANQYGVAESFLEDGQAVLHASSTGLDAGSCPGDLSNTSLTIPAECVNVAMRQLGDGYTFNPETGIYNRDFSLEIDFTIPSGQQTWNGGSGAIPLIFKTIFNNGSAHWLAFFPNKGFVQSRMETSGGTVYDSLNTSQVYGSGRLRLEKTGADMTFSFWENNQWTPVGQHTTVATGANWVTWFGIYNAAARDGINDITTEIDAIRITMPSGSVYTFIDDGYLNRELPPAWDAYGFLKTTSTSNTVVQLNDYSGISEVYWNRGRGVLHNSSTGNIDTGYNNSYAQIEDTLLSGIGARDFDLTVSFNLPQGYDPSLVGWGGLLRMYAYFSPLASNYAYVQLAQNNATMSYNGVINNHGAGETGSSLATSATTGKFRITRTGTTVTTAVWNNDAWYQLRQDNFLQPDETLARIHFRQFAKRDGEKELLVEFYDFLLTTADSTLTVNSGLATSIPYTYRIYPYITGPCTNWSDFTSSMGNNDSVSTPTPQATRGEWINHVIGTTNVHLQWQDTSVTETGYVVERCQGVSCDFTGNDTVLVNTGGNENQLIDNTLAHSTAYRYRVRARHDILDWYSDYQTVPAWDNSGWTITTATPQAPYDLTASWGSEARIELAWNDANFDTSGFAIERSNDSCATFTQIGLTAPDVHIYTDSTVDQSTEYCYRVRTFKEAPNGWSLSSNTPSITTDIKPPENVVAVMIDSATVDLSWDSLNETNTAFAIYRCSLPVCADNDYIFIGTTPNDSVTTYRDQAACAATTYTYKILPIRDLGSGNIWTEPEYEPFYSLPETAETTLGIVQPSNLTAEEIYNDSIPVQVKLLWSYAHLDEDGFMIERCEADSGPCTEIFSPTPVQTALPPFTSWTGSLYKYTEHKIYYEPYYTWDYYSAGTSYVHTDESTTVTLSVNSLAAGRYQRWIQTQDTGILTLTPYDFRVDYTLPNGLLGTTQQNDKYIGLQFIFPDQDGSGGLFEDYILIEYDAHQHLYHGEIRQNNKTTSANLATTDTSGSLRITRNDSGMAVWAYSENTWQKVIETIQPFSHAVPPQYVRIYNELNQSGGRTATISMALSNLRMNELKTVFIDTTVENSTGYTYRVKPYKDSQCPYPPTYSNTVAETIRPVAPTGLTAANDNSTVVQLQWTDNAEDEDGYIIEKYYIDRFLPVQKTDDRDTVYSNDSRTAYTKVGNEWAKTYVYRVKAYRGNDSSIPSNNDSVTLPVFQPGDDTCPPL